MKKLTGILLVALCLLLAFTACDFGGKQPVETTKKAEKIKKYTVTFDPNGGEFTGETSVKVEDGDYVEEPAAPTRDKYDFKGWYLDGELFDFSTEIEERITLVAEWEERPHLVHIFVLDGDNAVKEATCVEAGYKKYKCSECGQTKTETIPVSTQHKLPEVGNVVAPTCGAEGYTEYVCTVCGVFKVRENRTPATGEHTMPAKYKIIAEPTNYAPGEQSKSCRICNYTITEKIPALIDLFSLTGLDNFVYNGGKYENAAFVNVSKLAGTEASSFYTVCTPSLALDGDVSTYWQPDTLVDGANFTGEWFSLRMEDATDVGAVRATIPNYKSWQLGDGASTVFDVYAEVSGEWVKVGTMSDKDNPDMKSKEVTVTLVLDAPVNTSAIRFVVAQSSRYAPARIHEAVVLGYSAEIDRAVKSLYKDPVITVSSKWNSWAGGADKLNDNDATSYWYLNPDTIDAEGKRPYATIQYAQETYIAYVAFVTSNNSGMAFSLQYWVEDGSAAGGHFEEFGKYTVDSTNFGKFTIDMNLRTSAIRLENVAPGTEWWSCNVYDYCAYTITEEAVGLSEYSGCGHKILNRSGVVTAPTCDAAGYTMLKCKKCDYEIKTDSVDALGHKFGAYEVTTAPGSADGLQTRTCATCSATQTQVLPKTAYGVSVAPSVTNYYHNAPAAWTMTFDDGNYTDTYSWVVPQLLKYGYHATTVMSITFADSLTDMWKEYFASGAFDLGSHSNTHGGHYAGDLSETALLDEANGTYFTLMNWFPGHKCLGFASPGGATSDEVAQYLCGIHAANRNGGQSGGDYTKLADLKNRSKWGNLGSYIAHNTTTGAMYRDVIDRLVADNGWTIECIHEMAENPGSNSLCVSWKSTLEKFDYLKEQGVWVANFNEVIMYVKESQNAKLDIKSYNDTSMTLTLTDGLDDYMFNQALTLKVDLPDGWSGATATQNGKALNVTVSDGFAYVDAIPDAGDIILSK